MQLHWNGCRDEEAQVEMFAGKHVKVEEGEVEKTPTNLDFEYQIEIKKLKIRPYSRGCLVICCFI
jgi:hypothetical protein